MIIRQQLQRMNWNLERGGVAAHTPTSLPFELVPLVYGIDRRYLIQEEEEEEEETLKAWLGKKKKKKRR
jgi:hypothetical protein